MAREKKSDIEYQVVTVRFPKRNLSRVQENTKK